MADADGAILDQLRQVFDLCDEERCGYITSDKLKQLGREHFAGSEQTAARIDDADRLSKSVKLPSRLVSEWDTFATQYKSRPPDSYGFSAELHRAFPVY
ncbi:hypothetical protein HPB50_018405 [Hyalomma asiaticum]|uniref:Uncharacterized protein n=1 Tax=Hyalomma asiaticum TaxID=266040 RepID=A0ACB7T7Z7_HYAAI|nr:hypothetical protein HPB50_018405 [Hyalomma asiaticum]